MGESPSPLHAGPVPLHAALDLAALRTRPIRLATPRSGRPTRPARATGLRRTAVLVALAIAGLLLVASTSTTLGATAMTPKCDDVNLRTGPSTGYKSKKAIDEGARVTVVARVRGGHYGVRCAGELRSGYNWRKISAINGKSVQSLYGVKYLYGAAKLFKAWVAPPPPVPPDPPGIVTLGANVTFYGRGWGHGVGMSQYGAHGRALEGQLAPEILAHYYQGTVLGTINEKPVRVLVQEAFKAGPTKPVEVYGRGGTWTIDGVEGSFPADALLRFTPATADGGTTWALSVTGTDGTSLYDAASANSIRVRPETATSLQVASKISSYDRYRGVIRLVGKMDATATVNVINELPMETYLRGVVPSEVPATWPIEAVKAQAIAARSYAAYHLHPSTGTYDFHDDTRSQVYHGKEVEKPGSDQAILETANVVLRTEAGAVVTALFHSTGGGATENNENVFGTASGEPSDNPYSYLRGSPDRRADGTSYDDASPHADWDTKTYTLAQVQAWFAADPRTNVGTLVKLDLRDRGVSGRLISVTLIGADGTTKQVSGGVFRAIFNEARPTGDREMRSTLFDLVPIP